MLLVVVLPLLSLGLLSAAIFQVCLTRETYQLISPLKVPPHAPFGSAIAARGSVEPETECILVGSPVAGVVVEVFVRPGDFVNAGDPLFRLEDRHLLAELKVREQALELAQAKLDCLDEQPRPEAVRIAEARIRRTEAQYIAREDEARRLELLSESSAVAEGEVLSGRQAANMAQAELECSKAELALLRAGAWEPERRSAAACVSHAEAVVEQTKVEIRRLQVDALADGEVLQVNVRPGEFVSTHDDHLPIVLGRTRTLHVRVNIDEYDIPRFDPGASAQASVFGETSTYIPLEFVRIEPMVIPKVHLAGLDREKVDTRVLQAVYRINPVRRKRLFVGQQLDVFIEAVVRRSGEDLALSESSSDAE